MAGFNGVPNTVPVEWVDAQAALTAVGQPAEAPAEAGRQELVGEAVGTMAVTEAMTKFDRVVDFVTTLASRLHITPLLTPYSQGAEESVRHASSDRRHSVADNPYKMDLPSWWGRGRTPRDTVSS